MIPKLLLSPVELANELVSQVEDMSHCRHHFFTETVDVDLALLREHLGLLRELRRRLEEEE